MASKGRPRVRSDGIDVGLRLERALHEALLAELKGLEPRTSINAYVTDLIEQDLRRRRVARSGRVANLDWST